MEKKKRSLKKRIKQHYLKQIDKKIRSSALQKFFKGMIYLVGFVVSVILAAMLYFQN